MERNYFLTGRLGKTQRKNGEKMLKIKGKNKQMTGAVQAG